MKKTEYRSVLQTEMGIAVAFCIVVFFFSIVCILPLFPVYLIPCAWGIGAFPCIYGIIRKRGKDNSGGGLTYLQIYDLPDHDLEAFDPELYSEIEGIRELHVAKAMQDIADEKGIDWYSYWPELEKVVVEEQ